MSMIWVAIWRTRGGLVSLPLGPHLDVVEAANHARDAKPLGTVSEPILCTTEDRDVILGTLERKYKLQRLPVEGQP